MLYHLIILSPNDAADSIRKAAANAGAGKLGHYDSCSFSAKATGRFRAREGADPSVGSVGSLEEVEEEKIEMVATEEVLKDVLQAILKAHPYEEPAIHVLPMVDYKDFL